MLIENRTGKIGELLKKFNIKAYTFREFEECCDILDGVEKLNVDVLIALDTETTSLKFWDDDNYILGYSLAVSDTEGYYFNSRNWDSVEHQQFITKINNLKNDKCFWNWFFDYGYSKSHYGVGLDATHDGMLWFHSLFTARSLEMIEGTQKKKGFSLKELTAEYTEYGDYEFELKYTKKELLPKINSFIEKGVEVDSGTINDMYSNLGYTLENVEELENITLLINKYINYGDKLKERDFCYGFLPDNILDAYACLSKDSVVHMEDGSKERISDLVKGKSTKRVISFNESTKKFEPKHIYGWHKNKHESGMWYRFKFNKGGIKQPKFTRDHKLLTDKGYVMAEEINKGDKVLFNERVPNNDVESIILGSLIGDGSLYGRNGVGTGFRFSQKNTRQDYFNLKYKALSTLYEEDLHDMVKTIKSSTDEEHSTMGTPYSLYFSELNKSIVLNKKHSNFRPILTKDYLERIGKLGFAVWYFDDGTFNKSKNGNTIRLYMTHVSDVEIENVKDFICNTFGVDKTKIKYYTSNRVLIIRDYKKIHKEIYKFATKDLEYKIDLSVVEDKNAKYDYDLTSYKEGLYCTVMGIEIVQPKSRGFKTSWCIDVEDNHNFLTDAGIVHNCFDVLATLNLTRRCIKYANNEYNKGWKKVFDIIDIKHKATKLYADASVRGFKVDREYVQKLSHEWKPLREQALKDVLELPEIKKTESLIFRDKLMKEQSKKKKFNPNEFSKVKFSIYYRSELTKAQSKRKSILPLSRCRIIYINSKVKFETKRLRILRSSRVSLSRARSIYEDSKFNLKSSQHKKILFIDLMKLEPLELNKKNEKGEQTPKLNGDFVSHYAKKGYEFMEKINTYMLYQKGISSFLGTDEDSEKGLWNMTSSEHQYNHSNFNIIGTISSRLATSNLNLSQFPSRGVLHKLKDCFVVENGYKLFTFDYATSELRILGALAQEPNFIEAFDKGLDLHSMTAYSIWKNEMDIDENEDILPQVKSKYSETFRYFAKSINFSLPYGTTEFGLSKSIGVTKDEAKRYIEDYRKGNVKVAEFIDNSKDNVMKNGYTEGSYGERLYLKNAKGYNWRTSGKGKRRKNWDAIKEYKKATNFIIQSDNAFMLYYSLVSFFEEVKNLGLDIQLIATIYDSMYIRVDEKLDNKYVYDLMKKHFEVDFYGIPMKIDVGIALNGDLTYSNKWGHLTDISYDELDKITEVNLSRV